MKKRYWPKALERRHCQQKVLLKRAWVRIESGIQKDQKKSREGGRACPGTVVSAGDMDSGVQTKCSCLSVLLLPC